MRKFHAKILTDLSASPVRCRHFTLGNPKKSFQQYYSYILPIIYVIVYDYVFIYTKNYENRLIFDRVIQRLKRWTFLGTRGTFGILLVTLVIRVVQSLTKSIC